LKRSRVAHQPRLPRLPDRWLRRWSGSEQQPKGQSFVELAIIVPLLLFMALAVFDFARVFTSAITVEAAAREAADYGALYPWHWNEDDPNAIPTTVGFMEARACSAASTLNDYVGDPASNSATCTNPTFSYQLVKPSGVGNCYEVPRTATPCRVEVTVVHDFRVIIPLRLTFGDAELGFPSTVTLTRTSTFAVSDFELDRVNAP
jgi:Flp pilus assembly protein TadG